MKHLQHWLALCLGLALLFGAQWAVAADTGGYFAFQGGWNSLDDMDFGAVEVSYDNGSMYGVAGGYDYGWVRLEGEVSQRKNDVDEFSLFGSNLGSNGEVTLTTILLNVYFEWDNSTLFIPYVGFGLGAGKLDFEDVSGGGVSLELDDDWGGATQLILGVGYDLGEHWNLYTDWRGVYVEIAPSNNSYDEDDEDDYFGSTLTVGAQYHF